MHPLMKFVGRKDVYAVQQKNGIYIPVYEPVTKYVLDKHLYGNIVIGTYLINLEDMCEFGVVDVDGDKTNYWQLKNLSLFINEKLSKNFNTVLEFSGRRGYHIWVFPSKQEPAGYIRELILTRLKLYGIRNIEVYPKQNSLKYLKLGSLVKLPCGKHLKGWWSQIIE